MQQRFCILYVANKRLPETDYRIGYRRMSDRVQVVYALPERPGGIGPQEFVHSGFTEGIGLGDVGWFYALVRHLRNCKDRYHLVHFYSTKLQLLGPVCAALAGLPSVTTITGFGRTFNRKELRYRLLRPAYLMLARISVSLARATLFQNHGDMRWLAQRLPSLAHKMSWIGSGIVAEPVRRKRFDGEPLKVLMVARLMPDKGVPAFLECASRLHKCGFQFLLAGPTSHGQRALYDRVEQAHRAGIIKYFGELDPDALSALYRSCQVFMFPSRGEGMPRVMLEAGYAQMCPVASDISAHRDLVHSGGGFLLAAKGEIASMVSILQHLNADRKCLERNAVAYQQHILEYYSVRAYTQRMDAFLLQVLSPTSTTTAGGVRP